MERRPPRQVFATFDEDTVIRTDPTLAALVASQAAA
jgi:hypothetical protein